MFDKKLLVNNLELAADLMELKGENKFKVSAFRNGALTLKRNLENLEELIASKEIEKVKGIGKGLLAVIYEYHDKNTFSVLDELMVDIPDSLLELFEVRGLGPKKIAALYNELKIISLQNLETACVGGEVEKLSGFSKKTVENILSEIEKIKHNRQFILMHEADKISNDVSDALSKMNEVEKFSITGNVRRLCEITDSVEFVALGNSIDKIFSQLKSEYYKIEMSGNKIIISDFRIAVIIYFTDSESQFVNALFETTGSKEYLNRINFKIINEAKSEYELFEKKSLNYLPPENREIQFLESKLKHASDLSIEQFQSLLHFHTTYSDGRNSLEQMISKGMQLGYKYFAVCDHSKVAAYANGLNEERLQQQADEIVSVSKKLSVKIFKGSEVDILAEGQLDFSNETLSQLDFVVASVHSRFQLAKDEMTKRMIAAIENPHTNVLAHPTGRLLLSRDGYEVDIKKIIDACAQNKVAIEINANPHRLDLDWRNIFYAREKGCFISINADAHSVEDIELTKYGVMVARKAGTLSSEVINCFDEVKFNKFLLKKLELN